MKGEWKKKVMQLSVELQSMVLSFKQTMKKELSQKKWRRAERKKGDKGKESSRRTLKVGEMKLLILNNGEILSFWLQETTHQKQ